MSLFVAALPLAEAGGPPTKNGPVNQAALAKKMKAVHESFVENKGQWNKSATFRAQAPGYDAWLTKSGITFDYYHRLADGVKGHVVKMSFVGSNGGTSTIGTQPINHVSRYMTRSGGTLADARQFKEVMRHDVYPGVSVRNYFDKDAFRYDFILDPKSDSSEVKLGFAGATSVAVKAGDLKLGTQLGTFGHGKLYAYQFVNGKKQQVQASFKMIGKNEVGFALGAYDHSKSLIIDPVVFGTYFGGNDGWDEVHGVVADSSSASVYFTGGTYSTDFPITAGPYYTSLKGTEDAFVVRLQGDAYNLDYSVFFGGSNQDYGQFIKLDPFGNVWVAGITTSPDFPTNTKSSSLSNPDIFVIRFQKTTGTPVLDPVTSPAVLVVGGSGAETLCGFDIAPSSNPQPGDPVNFALIGHATAATTEVPGTYAANKGFLLSYSYSIGAFGKNAAASFYVGDGLHVDLGGLALDSNNNIYIAGNVGDGANNYDTSNPTVAATTFITTPNLFTGSQLIQKNDLFARKYSSSGAMVYSYIVGGEDNEVIGGLAPNRQSNKSPLTNRAQSTSYVTGSALAIDSSNNVYITGETTSVGYPRTRGAYNQNFDGFPHVVVTKVRSDGTQILYSTSLGTNNYVVSSGIAVDGSGTAYITGMCEVPTLIFPVPLGDPAVPTGVNTAIGTIVTAANGTDAPAETAVTSPAIPSMPSNNGWLSVLDTTGTTLLYSTYIDGFLDEGIYAPYVDAYGDCWVSGWIQSKREYEADPVSTGTTPSYYPGPLPAYDSASFPNTLITNLAYKPSDQSDGGFQNETAYFGQNSGTAPAPYINWHSTRDGFLIKFRVGRPVISAVNVTPSTLPGGLGQSANVNITLSSAAPAGGAAITLTLTQNNAAATAASFDPSNPVTTASVVVPAGATSFTTSIPVYSSAVTANTQVLVQATYEGNFLIAPLEVVPWLSLLTVNPTAVVGGNNVTGTVTLAQAAPTGGITVALAASNSQITVPATVTVPAGQQSQSFVISTVGVDVKSFPTVTATFLGVGIQDQIELDPATLLSVVLNPVRVTGGTTVTGTVTLNGLPGPNFPPITVAVAGNPTGYTLSPSTLSFGGTTTATFTLTTPIETTAVTRSVVVTDPGNSTYGYLPKTLTAALTVDVSALLTFVVDKTTASPGDTINATITLNNPADAGGANVTLTSSNPSLIASTTLNVPSASSGATIPLTVTDVEVFNPTTVVLTASRGTASISRTITINESTISLVLSQSTVLGGNAVTGTITLSDPAPAGFVVTVTVPGYSNISVPFTTGATTATFTISTVAVSADQQITVTASVGNLTATAGLLIQAPSLNTISFAPSAVRGTMTTTCQITLTAPAPAGGAVVSLTNSNTSVATIPATVTIPAGKLTYSFTVLLKRVSRPLATQVTASFNSQQASALLTALR